MLSCDNQDWEEGDYLLDDAGLRVLRLEEGQERSRDVHKAREVDADLLVESLQIDLFRLGEVVDTLDARIEENAVEIGVPTGDILDELAQVLGVVDVVSDAIGFAAAVFLDKVVNTVLAAANSDDFGAFANELLGHTKTDAGGGADHEHGFVGEGHFRGKMGS